MKTGKDTARFQYVAKESQMTGSHAEFPVRTALSNQQYNPHSDAYVIGEGSGSLTAQIDPFRQGVSVLTDTQRAMCALPTFNPANAGIDREPTVYGTPTLAPFSWPFIDKPNMENIGATEGLYAHAAGNIPSSSFVAREFQIIQADKRYVLSDLFNGVAETFPRILKGFLPKIFSRSLNPLGDDATPGIKAHIMQGNEAYKKGTSLIKPLIPMQVFGTSPFVDRGGKAAISPSGNGAGLTGIIAGTGSGSMPALVTTPDRRHGLGKVIAFESVYGPEPFDEASFDSRMFTKAQINSLNLDDDFKFTLLSNISGSTENMIPEGFKSARTGFIFTNNGLNVDSIAFGGLRRDA